MEGPVQHYFFSCLILFIQDLCTENTERGFDNVQKEYFWSDLPMNQNPVLSQLTDGDNCNKIHSL